MFIGDCYFRTEDVLRVFYNAEDGVEEVWLAPAETHAGEWTSVTEFRLTMSAGEYLRDMKAFKASKAG